MTDDGGARVERTGIALVHEGELIVPAPDAAALFGAAGGGDVHYYFPVEIEVRNVAAAQDAQALVHRALDAFAQHLGS